MREAKNSCITGCNKLVIDSSCVVVFTVVTPNAFSTRPQQRLIQSFTHRLSAPDEAGGPTLHV